MNAGCRMSHFLKSRRSWRVTVEGTQCPHLTFMHTWNYTHIHIHTASCILKYRLCPRTHSLFKNATILLYLFRFIFVDSMKICLFVCLETITTIFFTAFNTSSSPEKPSHLLECYLPQCIFYLSKYVWILKAWV